MRKIIYILLFLPQLAFCQSVYQIPESGFRKCLINNYNHLLDDNDDLILALADTTTEDILCQNYEITDITGIAYFKNTTKIDFSNNKIENFIHTGIDTMYHLKTLNLGNNLITSLPSFKRLINLEVVSVQNNFLTQIPTLENCTKIKSISLHTNQLAKLPDLTKLTTLEFLNIARNQTLNGQIDFTGLDSLKVFYAWLTSMKVVPDISKLTKLQEFNVAYNELTSLPSFENSPNLIEIYANHNKISVLPDFSTNLALEKVRLYNNLLTLDQIESTTYHSNYKTIMILNPQEVLNITIPESHYEGEDIHFILANKYQKSTIEINWYKNNQLILITNADTFKLKNITIEDNGNYFYVAKSTLYPDLTLYSDTIKLHIKPCFEDKEFEINYSNASCNSLGKISITTNTNRAIFFNLENSKKQKITFTNEQELIADNYLIFATDNKSCTNKIKEIQIFQEKCEGKFFTPNGDGQDDYFYFETEDEITVYDKWGTKLKTIQGPITWDGMDASGKALTPGYYTIKYSKIKKIDHISILY